MSKETMKDKPPHRADWISLEDVSLMRGGKLILDGIDWKVSPGTHWVLLGPNGSGKTTLLQLLAGYLWPTRGEITVLGEKFGHTDLRELRKKIGWVGSFLQAQIPPSQKPLDLVVSGKFASIGIFDSPSTDDYAQAREMIERLQCGHILESPYGVLSQGEKQRLLIARSLIHNPRLLIMDEPCAGLDMTARERLLQTLQNLGTGPDSPTLIFVTHHLHEIMPVFSHIFLIKEGKCVASGKKSELLTGEHLSRTFDIPLEVQETQGRYWTQVWLP